MSDAGVCMSARVRGCVCVRARVGEASTENTSAADSSTVQCAELTPQIKAWVNVLTFATVLPLPGMFTICNLPLYARRVCRACRACAGVRLAGWLARCEYVDGSSSLFSTPAPNKRLVALLGCGSLARCRHLQRIQSTDNLL